MSAALPSSDFPSLLRTCLPPPAGASAQPRTHAQSAYLWACTMDVAVRKPDNVSLHSAGHDMRARQFLDSAHASAPALFDVRSGVGARIEAAVRATRAVAGSNTNLGILLLCAPLARAAEGLEGVGRLEALEGLDLRVVTESRLSPAGLTRGAQLTIVANQLPNSARGPGVREKNSWLQFLFLVR